MQMVSLLCHRTPDQADVLISCGDLHDEAILRAVAWYCPRKVFAVRGNHDPDVPFPLEIKNLHCTFETFNGVKFGGFEGSWRYKPRGHRMFDQGEVSAMMRGYPSVDVFVSHNSPAGIHERDKDVHQGFDGFTSYLHRARPGLMIHGHQHANSLTFSGKTAIVGVYGESLICLDTAPPVTQN